MSDIEKPNYLTKKSENAENEFEELIKASSFLGFDYLTADQLFSSEKCFEAVSKMHSDRLDLVAAKLNIPQESLNKLSSAVFSDKVLGIDKYFRYQGKIFGADIATGKSSSIINKRKKILEMKDVYTALGINNTIAIRIEKEIDDDLAIIIFSLIEKISQDPSKFYMEFRINKHENFNDVYFSY